MVEELAVVCGMIGWGELLELIYTGSCSDRITNTTCLPAVALSTES